jgi:hypothetical protein
MSDKQVQPEPDIATKPKDIVGYCFGFACPEHHVQNTFDSITVDKYGEQRVCQTCGGISTPAIVKRISEAMWIDTNPLKVMGRTYSEIEYKPDWGWNQHHYLSMDEIWTNYEFVRFLNDANPRESIKGEKDF